MKTIYCIFFLLLIHSAYAQNINRQAVVSRHNPLIIKVDTLASLSVGNGKFAFTADVTGLQTFPEYYQNGIPLGTQSEWGWHAWPNPEKYKIEEAYRDMPSHGRMVPYAVQISTPERNKNAVNYLRQNPHRLQLGNVGFEILKKDGTLAQVSDIQNIQQKLNAWTGEISSHFTVEGTPVEVVTLAHQTQDVVAVKVNSALLTTGRLKIKVRFPYPTNEFLDNATNYKNPEKHNSAIIAASPTRALINRRLDTTQYYVELYSPTTMLVRNPKPHEFLVSTTTPTLNLSVRFTQQWPQTPIPTFAETQQNSQTEWPKFWKSGGFIDFAGTADPRAKEIERRMILSLYLTKIQCAGSQPPQETGLTQNSWYGKPHLEMHWWHGVHFALWGRPEWLENSMQWYFKAEKIAREIAQRQGFEGVRWQKMTDPWGNEAPSSVGAYLLWQQPHFIYFSELIYRQKSTPEVLKKYSDLVFKTADFMASFAYLDPEKGRYILGKGVIPAQERFKPEETFNPTYELAYWRWALETAQTWRERMKLPRHPKWDEVLQKLSPLPQADGVYLATESAPDSYTNPKYLTDHPSVLGTYGMLPKTKGLDVQVMDNTFEKIWKIWTWGDTWGWDFPMVAMTATRLGKPDKAIEGLLMNIHTNSYLPNGHNYQDKRLRLYLPGNGGLLAALAMMAAGYDEVPQSNIGFPKGWKVKWEGLKRMP
ncbi:MAG: hypothetical protein U0Y10_08600 [Spirosomataceae bacterium]